MARKLGLFLQQSLYQSRHLFKLSQDTLKENGGQRIILWMHLNSVDDPWVISTLTYKRFCQVCSAFRESNTLSDLTMFNVHKQAALVISLVRPLNPDYMNYKHMIFKPDMCDHFPPLAIKYMPTMKPMRALKDIPSKYSCSYERCDGTRAKLRCSVCKLTRYCNAKCQQKDWKQHKKTCVLTTSHKNDTTFIVR